MQGYQKLVQSNEHNVEGLIPKTAEVPNFAFIIYTIDIMKSRNFKILCRSYGSSYVAYTYTYTYQIELTQTGVSEGFNLF